jgi:hypothetical protein
VQELLAQVREGREVVFQKQVVGVPYTRESHEEHAGL